MACADLGPIGDTTVDQSALLVLPVQGAPAPATRAFAVPNDRASVHQLIHPDGFNTLYLELAFSAGALDQLDGNTIPPDGSVTVTVRPRAGGYGFTLLPSGLIFTPSPPPTVLLSYGQYADFSVADGSPRYPTRLTYQQALALWFEITPGRWQRIIDSGAAGIDQIAGPAREPGQYVVAALR